MSYPVTEKLEITRLVEHSHLPVRCTLRHLGVSKTGFYRWYDRYQSFGEQGLNRRQDLEPAEPVVRYERDRPSEMKSENSNLRRSKVGDQRT
jgi:transposase-like protein